MNIQVPRFMDTETKDRSPIHMDAMGFGMGSCCLQVTFQAEDLRESRLLYDQLVVLAPLMVGMRGSCEADGADGLLADLSRHAVGPGHALERDQPVGGRPHTCGASRISLSWYIT